MTTYKFSYYSVQWYTTAQAFELHPRRGNGYLYMVKGRFRPTRVAFRGVVVVVIIYSRLAPFPQRSGGYGQVACKSAHCAPENGYGAECVG